MKYATTVCLLLVFTWVTVVSSWKWPCRGHRGCPFGWECDLFTGRCVDIYPQCRLHCPRNQHCELRTVFCIRAPCPAEPTCVSGREAPCDFAKCDVPERSINIDGQCICLAPPGQQVSSTPAPSSPPPRTLNFDPINSLKMNSK